MFRPTARTPPLALSFAIALLVCNIPFSFSSSDILRNPSFESGVTDWLHDGFTMESATDQVHGGVASVKCTGRTNKFHGPSQNVNIQKGKQYVFKSYMKIVNEISGHRYQQANVKIRYDFTDGTHKVSPICQNKFMTSSDGWNLLGADFTAPNKDIRSAKLNVDGPLPHIDFYFDDASLTELADDVSWEQKANQRIENLRKSNIHVDVNLPGAIQAKDVVIQLTQLKHSFGWGSLVRSDWMIDPDYKQYQEVVSHMFNWATIQDYKWRYNRGNRTHPDYTAAVAATDVLNKLGIQVRGHCMVWAVNGKNPDWVSTLSGPQLKQAVNDRIAYMTNITKNKLAHWDVNNELVHGRFFEQHTGDPHYSEKLFSAVHKADPSPTLFLNDFAVIARGQSTQAFLSQILQFKAANVSLGGIGLQSHYIEYKEPNPAVINSRLDLLAQAGLPIWITELDMTADNESSKADWLERVMRLYFAHPAVQGVVLWGFWDHDMADTDRALVQGYSFHLNESGERYMKLVKDTWSTNVNTSLAAGTAFDTRGFRGDYEAIVWHKDVPIKRVTFTLGDVDKSISITVSGNDNAITLPTKTSPFDKVGVSHPTNSSPNLHAIGHAASSASTGLTCTNRWSRLSAVGAGEEVHAQCQGDEVLTACTSLLKNNDWHRKGEMIRMENGKPVCRAVDGYLSTAGIQAVARCCSMKSLSCDYLSAGPSGSSVDDRVEVPCPINSFPFGCSTYTSQSHSDGSFFTNSSCISQNDDPSKGVDSYAACCQGPNLQCTTVVSGFSGLSHGDKVGVTCPSNYVMTGCNVYSQYGRTAGAYISHNQSGDICNGVNGADKSGSETGVQAHASCCRESSN